MPKGVVDQEIRDKRDPSSVNFISEDGNNGVYEDQEEEDIEEESKMAGLRKIGESQKWWGMLVSHALSAWCVRSWEFTASLLLYSVRSKSLLLPALYGLFESLIIILLGPRMGAYVDNRHRLRIPSIGYSLQSVFIGLSAVSVLVLLTSRISLNLTREYLLIGSCIFFGGLSRLAGLVSTLSVEKDWAPNLCKQDKAKLAILNATFRRIDLVCKIGAPLISGLLMTYVSKSISALAIALYSLFLWPIMYLTLRVTYYANEDVLKRNIVVVESSNEDENGVGLHSPLLSKKINNRSTSPPKKPGLRFSSWRTYFRQEVTLAGLSLALLYLTVLSFGALMTSYGKSRGMSELVLSILRGGGTICGLLGTFVYPRMHSWFGTNITGLWMLTCQWVCIGISVLPFILRIPGRQSHLLLFEGVMASRYGLWGFDLSITQMLQMRVEETQRAEINGVQSSLQNALNMCASILSVAVSDPQKFNILAFISFGAVTLAILLYLSYLNAERLRKS